MSIQNAENKIHSQLLQHVQLLYPSYDPQLLVDRIVETLRPWKCDPEQPEPISEIDCLLIAYGDSITGGSETPLRNLKHFLDTHCRSLIPCVHILPFYPYSSDDGFSVIDYRQVRPELGNWQDVTEIAKDYRLMADLVINHASAKGTWFQEFRQGKRSDFFTEARPGDDLSQVTRPRTTPLLRPTETADGIKQIWCTFSHDQVDFNFKNPEVLIEILDVIGGYLKTGARILRLDAIGYLWKESGTPCIHLAETHEVVRLIRNVCDFLAPGTLIITETNVPNQENLTYFGNRNEAHAIYNFSLPPLLIYSLLKGESKHLNQWMMSMPPAPDGCFYLNFIASHDGIGMRPAEGLLSHDEQHQMLETLRNNGGRISTRAAPDGTERVYEVNISLFDALKSTILGPDDFGIERFLCSQTVMLGAEGVPAFYIHSLLATPNDEALFAETGRNRSVNRHRWDINTLEERLADPTSNQSRILSELLRRIGIRTRQSAFHPNATQFTLQMGQELFAFWRQSRDRSQSIFAIHNLTPKPQSLRLGDLNLISVDRWTDLLTDVRYDDLTATIELEPYACLWISNRDH